ncbi:MAG: REP-associated tyrosine transposase [Patescibacteria group bacterium]|jgi:REP element-mobilizing transposase RayT|nr:REP-associated tyrosine transposase [Patescibacteria group bacterium]
MPSKFIKRDFVKNGFYHIYNSSHEGTLLFKNDEDFSLFIYYLTIYLTPLEILHKKLPELPVRYYHKNLANDITLFSYTLLPDHFHLLVSIQNEKSLPLLMKQLANAYMQYVSTVYKPKSSLFSGRYKATQITDKKNLSHLARHFHMEPVITQNKSLEYPWSSYQEYTGLSQRNLCSTDIILKDFPSIYAFKKFHEKKAYQKSLEKIKEILIEDIF